MSNLEKEAAKAFNEMFNQQSDDLFEKLKAIGILEIEDEKHYDTKDDK